MTRDENGVGIDGARTVWIRDSAGGKRLGFGGAQEVAVSVYACGITPYSESHMGHARSYAVFDLLERVLVLGGAKARLVRNVTDIDDKTVAAGIATGIGWKALSRANALENEGLMRDTGLGVPEGPLASDHVDGVIEMAQALIRGGFAYVSDAGDVFYSVESYRGSTVLAAHEKGALRGEQGESRVSQAGKRDSRDFAVWKAVGADEPGWESPFGRGRPGWHAECSAMIGSIFNGSVDIHGGGADLRFPHHQAEAMQSESVSGRPLARAWAHNGSVTVNGGKMGKSLGNAIGWRGLLDLSQESNPGAGGDVLRLALLSGHWQKPMDWTVSRLDAAGAFAGSLAEILGNDARRLGSEEAGASLLDPLFENLNFPMFGGNLLKAARAGNAQGALWALRALGFSPDKWGVKAVARVVSDGVEREAAALATERDEARRIGDWKRADELREALARIGFVPADARVGGKAGPKADWDWGSIGG